MIGKLLGHTQIQTTVRYGHLAADPVKAAVEQVGSEIAKLVLREESGKAAVNGEHLRAREKQRPSLELSC